MKIFVNLVVFVIGNWKLQNLRGKSYENGKELDILVENKRNQAQSLEVFNSRVDLNFSLFLLCFQLLFLNSLIFLHFYVLFCFR